MKHHEHEMRKSASGRYLAFALASLECNAYPQAVFWCARALLELTHFADEDRVLAVVRSCIKEG